MQWQSERPLNYWDPIITSKIARNALIFYGNTRRCRGMCKNIVMSGLDQLNDQLDIVWIIFNAWATMSMNIFVQLTRPTAQSTSKPRIHMNQVRFVLKFSSLWHCRFARKRSFHRSGKRSVDSRLGGGEVQRIYTMIDDASDKFGDVFFRPQDGSCMEFCHAFLFQVILLMEEILHHLGCLKPCK